ncbi:MAG: hypothetical protein O2821_10845 [Chloroflexi bacterium]|nr:hypothetical protein [Chloroflexota bacterium]MDA1227275.1 hypothetical protein [Chloroflexota bacterium]
MVTRQRRLRSAAIFGLLALAALVTLALTACDRINPPSPLLEEKIRRPLLGDAIVLDPTVTYQTMVGWGATAQAGQSEFASDYPKWRDQVMDLSVNEVGINRVRLEIPSGLESPVDYFTPYINGETDRSILKERRYAPENDNDDPASINPDGFQFAALDHTIDHVVLPMKRRVEANGERLYVNLNYVGFNEDATLHRANPDEYAELMLATFQHMQADYGFVPDAIEIILEPDLAGWNGKEIGQAIVATGRTLETNGFKVPAFIGPSTTSMSSAIGYFEEMIDVPGVSDYLTEVSYHRYRGASESNAQKLADRAAEYGLQTAMLEHIGADYNELHQDLTVGNNSSWQQYTLAFPVEDNGAQYIVLSSPEDQMPGVQIGRRTRYLQQYFKYIRAGAQRIEATRMEGFSPRSVH